MGAERDPVQAAAWLRRAAESGLPRALRMLGRCYAGGLGVERDAKRAAELYRQAIDAGEAEAEEDLRRLEGRKRPGLLGRLFGKS